jgi:hypothetical protein
MTVHLRFNNNFSWFNDDDGTLIYYYFFNIRIIYSGFDILYMEYLSLFHNKFSTCPRLCIKENLSIYNLSHTLSLPPSNLPSPSPPSLPLSLLSLSYIYHLSPTSLSLPPLLVFLSHPLTVSNNPSLPPSLFTSCI